MTKETVDFIIETCKVQETSPLYHKESVLIDSVFKEILLDYTGIKKSNVHISTEYLFNLLFLNSNSVYEDAPDLRRMTTRRSLCFAAIALKAKDFYSALTFFDFAEYSILYKCPNEIESLLETNFCGLLFLELLVSAKYSTLEYERALKRLENFVSEKENEIDPNYIEQAKELIENFKQKGIKSGNTSK